MDRIRTLLLARTHMVVMDPDLVASAATRPTRDSDVEKFEDELAQLGFVMSLDLAMTMRRLPYQAMQELRGWIFDTLAKQLGAHRPHVPLFRAFPDGMPADTRALYLRRILSWLLHGAGSAVPVVRRGQGDRRARSVRSPRVPDVLGRRQLRGLPDLSPPRRARRSVRASRATGAPDAARSAARAAR